MRVALLSLAEMAQDAPDVPLASLALAGRSVAERQLDLALALGCERIVCLSQGLDRRLIALQHRAEGAGAAFNLITGARALAGLVDAGDEVLIIAPGLLPMADEARHILSKGQGILVLPVDVGLAAGFERIDLNHAWAGMLAMPGGLVDQLMQLPPDCDTISALLRIALQGRIPEKPLSEKVLENRDWVRLSSAEDMERLEPEWFRKHSLPISFFSPGGAMTGLAMRRGGAWLMQKGVGSAIIGALGGFSAVIGLAAAVFGHPLAGMALCALGWLLAQGSAALHGFYRSEFAENKGPALVPQVAGVMVDIGLVLCLAFALTGGWAIRLFPPIMMLGMIRLSAKLLRHRAAALIQDRLVLALLLILAGASGVLLPTLHGIAVALLAVLIGLTSGMGRLTQT